MYEQMHILSTLVAPREYAFLRYCIKCDQSSWIIVDVSYSCCAQMNQAPPTRYWKLPSGCKIQTLPNGNSKVSSSKNSCLLTMVTHNESKLGSLANFIYYVL